MPSLFEISRATPDKPACIKAETGEALTYATLFRHANRLANLFDDLALQEGDRVAIVLDNDLRYLEVVMAARERGLYYVPVSWHLTPREMGFILRDCGARATVTNAALEAVVRDCGSDAVTIVIDSSNPSDDYQTLRDRQPDEVRVHGRPLGKALCYSGGTTGLPKGVWHDLRFPRKDERAMAEWVESFRLSEVTVLLSPAPLYHTAPLRMSVRVIALGGTAVIMHKFDAAQALRHIEHFRITHSQWVPTMFFRMLALPQAERCAHDLSSHQVAIHNAAPCPPSIKRQMIDWWGPILVEFYGGSEGSGTTLILSEDWLEHPGSVGREKLGKLHILDENEQELGPNRIGKIYFDGPKFKYFNDPEKTARAFSHQGWSTLGDIGHVDENGYLFLADRQAHLIISGGVNIYPLETENVMMQHPDVLDVGVFGIPNEEFGEEVRAAVELRQPERAGPDTERAILAFCGQKLSSIKVPRGIDFHTELPRLPNGKLNKEALRKPYLERRIS